MFFRHRNWRREGDIISAAEPVSTVATSAVSSASGCRHGQACCRPGEPRHLWPPAHPGVRDHLPTGIQHLSTPEIRARTKYAGLESQGQSTDAPVGTHTPPSPAQTHPVTVLGTKLIARNRPREAGVDFHYGRGTCQPQHGEGWCEHKARIPRSTSGAPPPPGDPTSELPACTGPSWQCNQAGGMGWGRQDGHPPVLMEGLAKDSRGQQARWPGEQDLEPPWPLA